MILAQGQTVRRMIVVALPERNEVCPIDEGQIGIRQFDAQAAGGTLKIVGFENDASERGVTTGHFRLRVIFVAFRFPSLKLSFVGRIGRPLDEQRLQLSSQLGKVSRDECSTKLRPRLGRAKENVHSLGHPRKYGPGLRLTNRWGISERAFQPTLQFKRLPKMIALQMVEWEIGCFLVVIPSDHFEVNGEPVAQCWRPRDLPGFCLTFGNQIEGRQ